MQKLSQVLISVILGLIILPSFSFAFTLVNDSTYSINASTGVISCTNCSGSWSSPYQYYLNSVPSSISTTSNFVSIVGSASFDLNGVDIDSFSSRVENRTFMFYKSNTGEAWVFTYFQGAWYKWSTVLAILSAGGVYDPSYITVSNATTTNIGVYIFDLSYYLDNNLLSPYSLVIYSNGNFISSTTVQYGVVSSSTNNSVILNNGINNITFSFCGLLGCKEYNTKYVNYNNLYYATNTPALTFNEFYDELRQGFLVQWNSVNDTCNMFNAVSTSSFDMAQCILDLTIPTKETLQQNVNTAYGLFPFNIIRSGYSLFSASSSLTKPVIVSGVTPSYLGGTSFSFGLTSGLLDWLWNATSTGKYGTASTETLSQRISRYLDPLFGALFGVYILSFFFRAFSTVQGSVSGYVRSSKRINSKIYKK